MNVTKSIFYSVVIWGHSLGTGVSCKLAEVLASIENDDRKDLDDFKKLISPGSQSKLKGVFLEAPFESILTAAHSHFCGSFLWILPKSFRNYILDTVINICDRFESITRAYKINVPVMIVHAVNDWLISVDQGINLAKSIATNLDEPEIGNEVKIYDSVTHLGRDFRLVLFPSGGHNNLGFEPQFESVVGEFIENIDGFNKT